MGGYCVLLFTSCFVFILLVCSLDPRCIHAWTFRIQMLWRTFWYLFIQYKEYYQCEAVDIRESPVSMDLEEKSVILTWNASSRRRACVMLLPLLSYTLSGGNQPPTSTQSTPCGLAKAGTGVNAGQGSAFRKIHQETLVQDGGDSPVEIFGAQRHRAIFQNPPVDGM
ncbi:membrane-bound ghrelin O-acyltransferase mboat4 [Odontesthes bonariensis]|uniref:membrane-bound ghrelin O-acyltransferase mboat4 n=1 Tax=Odontesthes bonariensis TaxID=219752 RepID=UPI003F58B988